jgi:hypothetical protein
MHSLPSVGVALARWQPRCSDHPLDGNLPIDEVIAMQDKLGRSFAVALTALAAGAVVAGCVSRHETVVPAAAPTTVIVTPSAQRVVTYPEGRYELRGDGTTTNPYYWVWIPAGATPPNPPPPPRVP